MECQMSLTCNDLEKLLHKCCTNCCFCCVFTCFSVQGSQMGVLLSMDCWQNLFHEGWLWCWLRIYGHFQEGQSLFCSSWCDCQLVLLFCARFSSSLPTLDQARWKLTFLLGICSSSHCHESQSWAQSPLAMLKQQVEVLLLIQRFLSIAHYGNHCARLLDWMFSLTCLGLFLAPLPLIL